jgi:type I restriction enzyme S subunit
VNWKTVALGDVIELQNGYAFKSSEYADNGYFLMRITNVQQGFIQNNNPKFVKIPVQSKLEQFILNEGDILISLTGDVGRVGVLKEENLPAALNQRVARFTIKSSLNLDKKYLFNVLNSEIIRRKIESLGHGAAQLNVSTKDILSVEIPLPPLATQKKIVAKLDAIFTELEKATVAAEKNVKNSELYFPFFLDELIDSFQSKSVKKIEDVCDLYQGLAINKKTSHLLVEKSNLPLLRIKDLKNRTVEQYVAEQGFPKNSLVNEDEIIYTRTGSLGLVFTGRRGVLHNNSFKVVPKEGVDNGFLFWWLQSSKFKTKIMSLAMKAAQPDISHKAFKEQEILLPSLKEQKIFSIKAETALSISDSLKTIYQNKCKELTNLKQSILRQAVSGELVKE